MKYWDSEALNNKFQEISQRADRVAHEFAMGNPDEGVCDQLLRQIHADVGEILRQRKKHGWPE